MRRREERDVKRTRATTIVAAAATLLTLLSANAQVTGGALRMVEGASLSTPVDEAFHNIDEGLTVEGWFWLDELPEVGEVQTFFANPAKYALGVGIAEASRADEWYDPDEVRAFGSMWSEEGWGTTPKGIMESRGGGVVPRGVAVPPRAARRRVVVCG